MEPFLSALFFFCFLFVSSSQQQHTPRPSTMPLSFEHVSLL
jgi:hypothetical protein